MSQIENNEENISNDRKYRCQREWIYTRTPYDIEDQEFMVWGRYNVEEKYRGQRSESFEIFDLPQWVLNHIYGETFNWENIALPQNKLTCGK